LRESVYQAKLITKIEKRWPEVIIQKQDPNWRQGFPDLLLLFPGVWVALEVKLVLEGHTEPNQAYWVSLLDDMSFARFICPENESEVLDEIQQALRLGRDARVSQSE